MLYYINFFGGMIMAENIMPVEETKEVVPGSLTPQS